MTIYRTAACSIIKYLLEYHWQYADLENNDSLTVYNNLGHTDVMQFSIMSEGDGFFIDSGGRYLSKKDFYTENYSEYTAE